jgi:sulfatase modifying factor 1
MLGRHSFHRATAVVVIAVALVARASSAQLAFDWATVGDIGNPADTLVMTKGPAADFTTGYGSVGYEYRITTKSVTNSQYVDFLNTVDPSGSNALNLWDRKMADHFIEGLGSQVATTGGIDRNLTAAEGFRYTVKTGQEQFPAVWVRWASAARFVNWLSNGESSSGTESGVYDMSVLTSPFATPPTRAPGATVFLPSEDEYYKAAYYDPALNGGTGGYWQYGTRSNTPPDSIAPPGGTNAANIGSGDLGGGGTATTMATTGAAYDVTLSYLTDVGAYTSATSGYGLYDAEGLVYSWTEGTRNTFGNELPIYRGGSWRYGEGYDGAAYRNIYSGANVDGSFQIGFRVAALPAAPAGDIVIDVPSGVLTQAAAGYAEITTADSVTKTGAGTLVFDAANAYTGPTTIAAGTLEVSNSNGLSGSAVTVNPGGTLAIAPGTTLRSPSVIVSGGSLSAAALAVNDSTGITSLAINAGSLTGSPTVTISTGGTMALPQDARVTVAVGGLAVTETAGGGRLDLGAGMVTVAAGGISSTDLRADIIAGRNGGAWDGSTGITSAAAAAAPGGTRAVGYFTAGDGTTRVSFAAPGDSDLSGQVNIIDLVGIDAAGKFGSGQPADWSQGDFNYDGVTNVLDLIAIDTAGAFGSGDYFPAAASSVAAAAVPEPAVITSAACVIALSAAGFAARRLAVARPTTQN